MIPESDAAAPAAAFPELDAVESRILGCLIEKAAITPEVYPLTLNALVAACNQKTSRDPVMHLDPGAVANTLRRMEERGLVKVAPSSQRVLRYEHRFDAAYGVTARQRAVLCALLFFAGAARRSAMLPAVGFGLLVLSAILIGGLYPAIIQQFVVKPNELAKETPYIQREIRVTRQAYGLTSSTVRVTPYAASVNVPQSALDAEVSTLKGMRLLDPATAISSSTMPAIRSTTPWTSCRPRSCSRTRRSSTMPPRPTSAAWTRSTPRSIAITAFSGRGTTRCEGRPLRAPPMAAPAAAL